MSEYKLVSSEAVTYVVSKGPLEPRVTQRYRTENIPFSEGVVTQDLTDIVLEGWEEWEFCIVVIEVYSRGGLLTTLFCSCHAFGVIRHDKEMRVKQSIKIGEKVIATFPGKLNLNEEKLLELGKEHLKSFVGW